LTEYVRVARDSSSIWDVHKQSVSPLVARIPQLGATTTHVLGVGANLLGEVDGQLAGRVNISAEPPHARHLSLQAIHELPEVQRVLLGQELAARTSVISGSS